MKEKMRKTGIDILGDVSWGTHFCLFYQTREDLIDILVPYFKAGLENNEFCMWGTSEPLKAKEAKAALKKEVKNLDNYIKKGQIEMLDYSQWYTKSGMFEADKVLKGWVEKEKGAVKRGFDGLRLTGNTFWLEKEDWRDFADYEEKVNNVIGQYKMLAICSYSVDKWGASEVIDVVGNHQFALVKRKGKWVLIECSERKLREEALRESEEKYRSLFDNMLEGFAYCKIIVDKNNKPVDFIYIKVNDAFEALTGLKKDLVTGKRVTEVIPGIKKAHPELFKIYGKVALTGKPTNFDIYFAPLKIWLSISVYCPKKGYFVAVFDNITGRKQTEEALRESEERYRAIFEQAADSVVLVDAETGELVEFNDKAHENLGYTRKEFEKLKIPDFEVIESVEEVSKHIKKIRREGSDTFETKHRTKGGAIKNILVSARAISIGGRDFIQSIWRDITETKRVEEEKERLHVQLVRSEKMAAVGTLTSGIAHEFNNLLQIMRGHTELAQRTKKTKDMEKALDIVLNTSDEAAKIISDLLTFSRQEPSDRELCDITESIESVLSLIEEQFKNHNIKVVRRYKKTPKILINKAEMQQVFLNIITNARDAMLPQGGKLEIKVKRLNGDVEVDFSDTGKGIGEEDLGKVFEPFYTTKRTKGKDCELQGTGLGLSVSYGIVKRHRGTIDVKSEVGRGATFTVRLAVNGAGTERRHMEDEEKRKMGKTGPLAILAVDDEVEICNILTKWLSSEKHRVKSALTGKMALNLIRKEYFDIVLLDIVMPGIPAVEVLEGVKGISPKTEVVMMTGKMINKDLVSELRGKGASGLLQKPFRIGTIKRTIEDLR